MRLKDIEVGGQYQISQSKNSSHPWRCLVLDTKPVYSNARGDYLGNLTRVKYEVVRYQSRYRQSGGRIAVAVEIAQRETVKIDPVTGEPWTDEDLVDESYWGRQDRTRTLDLPPAWVPYAARMWELKGTWADELERRAVAEVERREADIRRADRDRLAAIEQKRQQEEYARADAEKKQQQAVSDEFYQTRIQPELVELGIKHHRYPGGTVVTINQEELHRLLGILRGAE